jgi:hypothetical protein
VCWPADAAAQARVALVFEIPAGLAARAKALAGTGSDVALTVVPAQAAPAANDDLDIAVLGFALRAPARLNRRRPQAAEGAPPEESITSRNVQRQWEVLTSEEMPKDAQGQFRPFTRPELVAKLRAKAEALKAEIPKKRERETFEQDVLGLLHSVAKIEMFGGMWAVEVATGSPMTARVQDLRAVGAALPYYTFFSAWNVKRQELPDGTARLSATPRALGARRIYLARAAGSHYESAYYASLIHDQDFDARIFTVSQDILDSRLWRELRNLLFAAAQQVSGVGSGLTELPNEEQPELHDLFEREALRRLGLKYEHDDRFQRAADRIWRQLEASGVLDGADEFLILDELDPGTYQLLLKLLIERHRPDAHVSMFVGDSFLQPQIPDFPEARADLLAEGFEIELEEAEIAAVIRKTETGTPVKCLSGIHLLASKRAADRPQDQADIAFLEELKRLGKIS